MTPQQTQFKADRFSNYAYAVIVPQGGASYAEQAADIVAQIQQHFADKQIIRQTVFLRDPNRLDETAQFFAAQQGAAQPLTAFVSQAPADGNLLAAEIVAVSGAEVTRVNNGLPRRQSPARKCLRRHPRRVKRQHRSAQTRRRKAGSSVPHMVLHGQHRRPR